MAVTNEPKVMYQGDTKDLDVYVVDSNAVKVDLTGATVEWVLYKTINDLTLVTKTTISGITLNIPLGIFTVRLNPIDTDALLGVYEYQAKVTDIRGYTTTVMNGLIEVKQRKK